MYILQNFAQFYSHVVKTRNKIEICIPLIMVYQLNFAKEVKVNIHRAGHEEMG